MNSSTVFEALKSDRVEAMRSANTVKFNLLSVLVGDIEQGRKFDNQDVFAKIKILIEKTEEAASLYKPHNATAYAKCKQEIEILNSYMPKKLSEEEIRKIISDNALSGVKDIMAHFKANYPSQYDGKALSDLAKTI